MEGLVQVKCEVKGPDLLKVGTGHNKNYSLNGCKSLMVTFSESGSANIAAITLTNRYCGILTIAARYKVRTENSGESFKFVWKCLVDSKKLMPQAHYATGAESSFLFHSSGFLHEANEVCSLKFVLQQPSTQYAEFGITDIKVYSEDLSDGGASALPAWLTVTTDQRASVGNPATTTLPVDALSQTLQRMWALAKKTSDMRQKDGVKSQRFDKDGFYEINLLTYQ